MVPQAAFGVAEGSRGAGKTVLRGAECEQFGCCNHTLGIQVQWQTWGINPWC